MTHSDSKGYFLPDPAYREWSKKKYDAGTATTLRTLRCMRNRPSIHPSIHSSSFNFNTRLFKNADDVKHFKSLSYFSYILVGRYYTFAAGDTVILRGLGTELNGLLAWVVGKEGGDTEDGKGKGKGKDGVVNDHDDVTFQKWTVRYCYFTPPLLILNYLEYSAEVQTLLGLA